METVKVFRFENADGIGPYTSDLLSKLDRRHSQFLYAKPSPGEDGCELGDDIGKYGMWSAFKDLVQLVLWVDGRLVVLREMGRIGLQVVEYEVPKDKVIYCSSQVVFHKRSSTQLSIRQIDDTLVHEASEAFDHYMENDYDDRQQKAGDRYQRQVSRFGMRTRCNG